MKIVMTSGRLLESCARALRMNSRALSDTLGTSFPSGNVTDVALITVCVCMCVCVCVRACVRAYVRAQGHRYKDTQIIVYICPYPHTHSTHATTRQRTRSRTGERVTGRDECMPHTPACVYVPTCTHAHIPPLPETPEDAVEDWERLEGEGERLAPGRGALSPDSFRGQKASRRTTSDRKSPLLTKHPPWTRSSAATIRRRSTPVADTSRCLHLVT